MCTVMDSSLKGIFVRAGKHTTIHGVSAPSVGIIQAITIV